MIIIAYNIWIKLLNILGEIGDSVYKGCMFYVGFM